MTAAILSTPSTLTVAKRIVIPPDMMLDIENLFIFYIIYIFFTVMNLHL